MGQPWNILRPENVAQATLLSSEPSLRHFMRFDALSWNPATVRTSLEDETPWPSEPSCPGKAISDQFMGAQPNRTEPSQDQQSSDPPASDCSHLSEPSQDQQAHLDLWTTQNCEESKMLLVLFSAWNLGVVCYTPIADPATFKISMTTLVEKENLHSEKLTPFFPR